MKRKRLLFERNGVGVQPNLRFEFRCAERESVGFNGFAFHVGSERNIIGVVFVYQAVRGIPKCWR